MLLLELFGDFPFATDADRTNALGALLLPFVRELVDDPTPLHLIEAPSPGIGKGLLQFVDDLVWCMSFLWHLSSLHPSSPSPT
jgi:hypothetical protein